jgi:MFS family permease
VTAPTALAGSATARGGRSQRSLIACLAFAAMTGSVVAGLGSPIVLEVSVDLGVSIASAQWILILALLVGVVCTPIVSRISDGPRRRAVLLGALLLTAAGCALGALIPSFGGLLASRALQGFGYAMVPLTVSIAKEHLRGRQLTTTLGVLSTSVAVGVGVGNPVMGLGVLVWDYRAAFAFGALVSAAGALWVRVRIPRGAAGTAPVSVDVPGALLLGLGLGGVLLAVARGQIWGWYSAPTLVLGLVGALCLAAWVMVELRVPSPLVDVRLAVARGLLGVNLSALLLGVCVFGGVAVVLLLAQRPAENGLGFGYSVFMTGVLMLPMALTTLASTPLATWLGTVLPPRMVLPLGSLLTSSAFVWFAVQHDQTWHIAVMMGLLGAGIGVAYSAMPALIVARTPAHRVASATGINQVLRIMGGSLGAAVMTAVLARQTPVGRLNPLESGYTVSLWIAASAGLVAAVVGYVLVPDSTPGETTRGLRLPEIPSATSRSADA